PYLLERDETISVRMWRMSSQLLITSLLCFSDFSAPLVINLLTPELITPSIIPWGYHYRPLYFLAWSAFAFAAAVFIAIIVSRPGREYITPQLSSRVSIH